MVVVVMNPSVEITDDWQLALDSRQKTGTSHENQSNLNPKSVIVFFIQASTP
jgi:hypothetical protein